MASKSSPALPRATTHPHTVEGASDVSPEFESAAAVAVPHYLGHRERLRDRFAAGGAEAMPDYELLELVLYTALPRRDIKPLAKALLARFGNFADAIAAPRERLLEIKGVGENVVIQLKIIEPAALRLSRTKVLGRPALSSWQALLDYCAAAMARSPHEQFRILFLDRKNALIADEIQGKGTVDSHPGLPPGDRQARA